MNHTHTVSENCQFHENRVFDLIFHLEEIEISNRQANANKFLYRKETTKHPIPKHIFHSPVSALWIIANIW